jgi:hypothetical protein
MCLLAVVLWASAGVLAQGQGKGQGGGDKERVKEGSPQSKAQDNAPAPEVTAEKNAGKGKAAKQAAEGVTKQGGPQGKKGQASTDTSDKGKGKGREQQAQAFQKQQQKEQAKHMERVARLNRIRELAVKKGDTETVARVDKLIAKEQEVYGRKQGKMQGQPRAVPTVGPNDVGARKGKSAAAEQKQKSSKQADEGVKEQKKTEAKPEKAKNQ